MLSHVPDQALEYVSSSYRKNDACIDAKKYTSISLSVFTSGTSVSVINSHLFILTMDNRSLDDEHPPKEVTAIISRKINTGYEKDYDDWGRRYMMLERKVPGYLGSTIIVPGGSSSSVRYIINRFSDEASLDAWENSEEAHKLMKEVNNYSTRYYERATGLETWFTLPDLKTIVAPPRWKMAIVSFIGAYIISSLAQYIFSPYLGQWHWDTSVVMNIILVVGLTYFVMPFLSRMLRRWLYPRTI